MANRIVLGLRKTRGSLVFPQAMLVRFFEVVSLKNVFTT